MDSVRVGLTPDGRNPAVKINKTIRIQAKQKFCLDGEQPDTAENVMDNGSEDSETADNTIGRQTEASCSSDAEQKEENEATADREIASPENCLVTPAAPDATDLSDHADAEKQHSCQSEEDKSESNEASIDKTHLEGDCKDFSPELQRAFNSETRDGEKLHSVNDSLNITGIEILDDFERKLNEMTRELEMDEKHNSDISDKQYTELIENNNMGKKELENKVKHDNEEMLEGFSKPFSDSTRCRLDQMDEFERKLDEFTRERELEEQFQTDLMLCNIKLPDEESMLNLPGPAASTPPAFRDQEAAARLPRLVTRSTAPHCPPRRRSRTRSMDPRAAQQAGQAGQAGQGGLLGLLPGLRGSLLSLTRPRSHSRPAAVGPAQPGLAARLRNLSLGRRAVEKTDFDELFARGLARQTMEESKEALGEQEQVVSEPERGRRRHRDQAAAQQPALVAPDEPGQYSRPEDVRLSPLSPRVEEVTVGEVRAGERGDKVETVADETGNEVGAVVGEAGQFLQRVTQYVTQNQVSLTTNVRQQQNSVESVPLNRENIEQSSVQGDTKVKKKKSEYTIEVQHDVKQELQTFQRETQKVEQVLQVQEEKQKRQKVKQTEVQASGAVVSDCAEFYQQLERGLRSLAVDWAGRVSRSASREELQLPDLEPASVSQLGSASSSMVRQPDGGAAFSLEGEAVSEAMLEQSIAVMRGQQAGQQAGQQSTTEAATLPPPLAPTALDPLPSAIITGINALQQLYTNDSNHCLADGCGGAELVLVPLDSVTRLQLGLAVLLGLGVLVYMELTTSQ